MNREGCLRRVVSDTVSLDRLCHRTESGCSWDLWSPAPFPNLCVRV